MGLVYVQQQIGRIFLSPYALYFVNENVERRLKMTKCWLFLRWKVVNFFHRGVTIGDSCKCGKKWLHGDGGSIVLSFKNKIVSTSTARKSTQYWIPSHFFDDTHAPDDITYIDNPSMETIVYYGGDSPYTIFLFQYSDQ